MEVDSPIAVVFRCLEDFLRKAGTLNVFETLVYNYRLKEEYPANLQDFSAILSELIQNLNSIRLEMEKRSTSKQNGVEHRNEYMITLDNSQYLPLIEEGDLKNVSVVVAGDLQTLFSVKLDPSQLQQQNNGGEENSSELYMIPILKEVKEDLSVKDICSMVGVEQQVEEPPSLASVQASTAKETIAKPKKKKKPAQKSPQQQQQLSKGQLPPPQQQTKDPLDDDNLLFSCCDKCFHSFRTQERFDSHKCTAKGGGKTSTLIRDNSGLRKMKKFVCGLCLEEYRNLDRISFHLKRCEGGPFTCEMCPPSAPQFGTMKSLNFHKIHEHKEERSFICKDCGFPFKFKCSLQKHKLRAHNTELQPRTFPCDQCSSIFLKKIFLTNHKLKSHQGEKAAGELAEEDLPSALPEESSEPPSSTPPQKPHSCPTCGKSFAKKSKLKEHCGRRHPTSAEASFKCTHCPKTFRTRKDQRQHMRRMHSSEAAEVVEKKKEVENGAASSSVNHSASNSPHSSSQPPPPSSSGTSTDDTQLMSDFMEALTPGQLEQIMKADFLVPTLIP